MVTSPPVVTTWGMGSKTYPPTPRYGASLACGIRGEMVALESCNSRILQLGKLFPGGFCPSSWLFITGGFGTPVSCVTLMSLAVKLTRAASGSVSVYGLYGVPELPVGRETLLSLLQPSRFTFLLLPVVQPERPRTRNVRHYASKYREKQ